MDQPLFYPPPHLRAVINLQGRQGSRLGWAELGWAAGPRASGGELPLARG